MPDLIERVNVIAGLLVLSPEQSEALMDAATALAEKDARIAELEAAIVVQRESKEYAQRCCITAESDLTASRAECEGLRAAARKYLDVTKEYFSDTEYDRNGCLAEADAELFVLLYSDTARAALQKEPQPSAQERDDGR